MQEEHKKATESDALVKPVDAEIASLKMKFSLVVVNKEPLTANWAGLEIEPDKSVNVMMFWEARRKQAVTLTYFALSHYV